MRERERGGGDRGGGYVIFMQVSDLIRRNEPVTRIESPNSEQQKELYVVYRYRLYLYPQLCVCVCVCSYNVKSIIIIFFSHIDQSAYNVYT